MIAFLIFGGIAIAVAISAVRLFVPRKMIPAFDRAVDEGFKFVLRASILLFIAIIALAYFGVIK